MDDLARWLRTQLDDDAVRAKAAPPGPWAINGAGGIVDADGGRVIPSVGGALDGRVSRWPEGPAGEHIVEWDPVRTQREIEAGRELLSRYEAMAMGVLVVTGVESILAEYRRVILPNLALRYTSRSGYREEWRP